MLARSRRGSRCVRSLAPLAAMFARLPPSSARRARSPGAGSCLADPLLGHPSSPGSSAHAAEILDSPGDRSENRGTFARSSPKGSGRVALIPQAVRVRSAPALSPKEGPWIDLAGQSPHRDCFDQCRLAATVLAGASHRPQPKVRLRSTRLRRRAVTANLWEWNWKSIAAECAVLAQDGYTGVQVAPPQNSLKRTELGNGSDTILHPWWEVYQPVTYDLTSRMGNEDQFKTMVTKPVARLVSRSMSMP